MTTTADHTADNATTKYVAHGFTYDADGYPHDRTYVTVCWGDDFIATGFAGYLTDVDAIARAVDEFNTPPVATPCPSCMALTAHLDIGHQMVECDACGWQHLPVPDGSLLDARIRGHLSAEDAAAFDRIDRLTGMTATALRDAKPDRDLTSAERGQRAYDRRATALADALGDDTRADCEPGVAR